MKRILIAAVLALGMVLIPVSGMQAATSADITINATPAFISITNSPANWTINSTGAGVISTSTTYYSNDNGNTIAPSATVLDPECRFTVSNTSTIGIDLTVNFSDFTGGDAMTNSNTGSAGANTFGAYAWASGATYASGKVVAKSSGSSFMKSNLLPTAATMKWGLTISTQTGAWTSGSVMSATSTITATAH